MSIDTIVFDLGNVLIKWDPRQPYYEYFKDKEKMEFFFENICTMDWNIQQDKGRSLQEATDLLIGQFPEWEEPIRMYYDHWKEMITGPVQGTSDLLSQLFDQERYRLLALTNWSAETFPYALNRFDFLEFFEGIFVSGEENMIKPDLEIYEAFQDSYNIVPENTLFIDDSLANVNGAIEAKWNAVQFVDIYQLKNDLKEYGVIFDN